MQLLLESQEATEGFAVLLASIIDAPAVVYLQGDLGAGKTTFVRALLHALGVVGRVKSPTYTIVEPYTVDTTEYYHFDLYRLGSPLELEAIGIQDYIHANSVCFVEWPDKGQGVLPDADLLISLQLNGQSDSENSRICALSSQSMRFQQKIEALRALKS